MKKRNRQIISDKVERKLDKATRDALLEREKQFALAHRDASDEALLKYLRKTAEELGKSPHQNEVIGGPFIGARFGGWGFAMKAAGLAQSARKKPKITDLPAYKEEYRRQARIRRNEIAGKKAEAQKIRTVKRIERETQSERDLEWGRKHENDSDEELLAYVRSRAKALGRIPVRREVDGGYYLRSRFGSWAAVLLLAGLELPAGAASPEMEDPDWPGFREEADAPGSGGD